MNSTSQCRSAGIEQRVRELEPGPSPARPHIEQSREPGAFQEPQNDVDAVLDTDEIAQLSAIGIPVAIAAEQSERARGPHQGEILGDHALHRALVVFVRPVDVEELETHALRRQRLRILGQPRDSAVDQMLAPPVGVERPQQRQRLARELVVEAGGAISVCRGRRGIQEGRADFGAALDQFQGGAHVVADDGIDIRLRGRADGAHMDDRLDRTAMPEQPIRQIRGFHDVRDFVFGKIAPAFVAAQPIADGDFLAARGQSRDDVRADESGAPCYDVHPDTVPSEYCRLCSQRSGCATDRRKTRGRLSCCCNESTASQIRRALSSADQLPLPACATCPAACRCARPSPCDRRSSISRAARSPDSNTHPFSPGWIRSQAPPTRVLAMTGLPHAIASLSARPQVSSGPFEGSTKTSPNRYTAGMAL